MRALDWDRIGSKEYARDVARCWDRLLGDYDVREPIVRDVVYESWLRCKKIGVDPQKRAAPKLAPVSIAGIGEGRLCRVISGSLATVAPHLAAARSVLIGTGRTGHIFFADGDPRLSEQLAENSVVTGASWDETQIGTNAIGTALATGQNVLIHGQEHFCNAGKQWSCAADVIRDPVDGSILGVVDLTGPAEAVSLRAAALISALVERIESELSRLDLMDQIALIDRFHENGHLGDSVVVVDRRGLVVRSSSHAKLAAAQIRQGAYVPGFKGMAVERWTLALTPEVLQGGEVEPISRGGEVIGAAIHISRRKPLAPAPIDLPLPLPLQGLLASAPSLSEVIRSAAIVAKNNVPVLVTGETGTGKDILANAIHQSGVRAAKPFISINCAAIPRDLIGVELFGYVEGAFTGTRRGGMAGRIENADGGTLFLDEIGDMPFELQPYLLRVLENGAVSRLGECRERRVNVRIIAATNQPLEELIEQRRFRSDLFYRLNVARLHLPPLRERRGDIPSLVERIDKSIRKAEGSRSIDKSFFDHVLVQELPGNVRELRAMVERHVAGLPLRDVGEEIPAPSLTRNKMTDIERTLILKALRRHQGNVLAVSAEMSIPRSTLYRKIAVYREQGFL